jgi:hypothetical protein
MNRLPLILLASLLLVSVVAAQGGSERTRSPTIIVNPEVRRELEEMGVVPSQSSPETAPEESPERFRRPSLPPPSTAEAATSEANDATDRAKDAKRIVDRFAPRSDGQRLWFAIIVGVLVVMMLVAGVLATLRQQST